jgi:uncharacterized protein (DUF2147 family)
MKRLFTIIATLGLLFAEINGFAHTTTTPVSAVQAEIEGDWLANGKFKIRFTRSGETYQGKIVWIKPGEETKDVHNANQALRSRDLVGVVMFDGFRYASAGKKYTGGTAYLPPAGKTMTNQELSVVNNQLKFKVRFGILSKTLTLTRA